MSRHCPTCTCAERLLSLDQLFDLLALGQPHREVYQAGSEPNRWFVTYGGGEADPGAVRALIEAHRIHRVYDDPRTEIYHCGKTLDMEATRKAREGKKKKNGWIDVYTDGTTEVNEWK